MMRIVLLMIAILGINIGVNAQDENLNGNLKFGSEYNQILWPVNSTYPYGGGITGDDLNYKRLTLFHGHSIDLQTGSNTFNHNNSRFYIDNIGNVGIGTRNPTVKLHIVGDIADSNGGILLEHTNHTQGISMGYDGIQKQTTNGNGILYLDSASSGNNYLALQTRSGGNVGIGTADTKGYKLAVAGKVVAEEVKIALQTSWPDYVFETNYRLPSLLEVEYQIKKQGHLKDIPSAKEVEENGIYLGEMNSKLLQKIEELTLYTIAQEKKIKELELLNKKFLELQTRLEILESEK